MRHKRARPDQLVAQTADRQHGVIALHQLLAAGLSRDAVKRRAQAARLHRLHQGVYSVGHKGLSTEGRWLAAVLACGEGAVLSHASAGALWNISPTSPSFVHVTVPSHNGRRKRHGITIHRSATLAPTDTTRRHNIPVTTRARTLRDLGYGPEPTRSHLERLFLKLCRRHGISAPEVNVRAGPYLVDFIWRDADLVAETDGYRYHSGRASFKADRARTNHLKRLGFEVLRFSYDEVTEEPDTVAASLQAQLHRRRRRQAPSRP